MYNTCLRIKKNADACVAYFFFKLHIFYQPTSLTFNKSLFL